MAEVVPIASDGQLDEALARALDPKRLLAIVAAHAGARQPTSWRAAMELLRLQGVASEAGEAPPEPVRDVWLELDELAAKRAGTSVAEPRPRAGADEGGQHERGRGLPPSEATSPALRERFPRRRAREQAGAAATARHARRHESRSASRPSGDAGRRDPTSRSRERRVWRRI